VEWAGEGEKVDRGADESRKVETGVIGWRTEAKIKRSGKM
jgi:hypothetical protein